MAANDCPLAVVGIFHVPSARTSAQQRIDVNVTNKSSTKNFKPEQKHNKEMLLMLQLPAPITANGLLAVVLSQVAHCISYVV